MKNYINHRLLKYHCPSFNYDKINNIAYTTRQYNKLLIWYYYNQSNDLISTISFTKRKAKTKWYYILEQLALLPAIKQLIHKYPSKKNITIALYDIKCKNCDTLISSGAKYCSNGCASRHKAKDPEFIKKLSHSVKRSHTNMSKLDKLKKSKVISDSVKSFNDSLTPEERKLRYANKSPNLTAFDNLGDRFPDMIPLFTKDEFYSERYLMVKCKDCDFKYEITKSTSICRTICIKCHPKRKHRTQTVIFHSIANRVFAKENDKSTIGSELDIVVPSLKFAIEYNGILPHSSGPSKISYYDRTIPVDYHLDKTDKCEVKGFQLFHIFENEYILNPVKKKIWDSMISNKLGESSRVFARKCSVKEITLTESKEFLKSTHLQGNCQSSVKLGLFLDDVLLQVMTFRKHRKYQWEIARFASKLNTSVVGGASKLLKHFERKYTPKSLISYANRRWSQGGLYDKLGFTDLGSTPPNYFYFKVNENIFYPREVFQKHKLEAKLETFDHKLTETKNMYNNGYRKIYDCGNLKYLKVYV